MKYVANPVEVNAYPIRKVVGGEPFTLVIGDADGQSENAVVYATPEMRSRMTPKVGDYWVIQSDGYVYLNPKDVFERKYHQAEPDALELGAAIRKLPLAGE